MKHTRSLDLVPIDLDIDKTLRRLNQERKQQAIQEVSAMGEENNGGNQAPNSVGKINAQRNGRL